MRELNAIERAILTKDLKTIEKAMAGKKLGKDERTHYFSQAVHNGNDQIASYFATLLTRDDFDHDAGQIVRAVKTAAVNGYVGVFDALHGKPKLYLGLRYAADRKHKDVAAQIMNCLSQYEFGIVECQRALMLVAREGWFDLLKKLPEPTPLMRRMIAEHDAQAALAKTAPVPTGP